MENNSTFSVPDIDALLIKIFEEQKKTNHLIVSEGKINKNEILVKTGELKLDLSQQFDILKKQNIKLTEKLDRIEEHNIELKEELGNNTSDRILKLLGVSFLIFFSISILFKFFLNYELVKFNWAKIGFLISMAVVAIGYFVGKMYKKELEC